MIRNNNNLVIHVIEGGREITCWYVKVLLIGLMFSLTLMSGGCKPSDYVGNEFRWIHDVVPELGEPLQQEKAWYAVYQLKDEQMEFLLKTNFTKQGYSDWQDYTERCLLGTSSFYHLDGLADPIRVCVKQGSSDYNKIAIFIDLKRKRLILFYGITYGC